MTVLSQGLEYLERLTLIWPELDFVNPVDSYIISSSNSRFVLLSIDDVNYFLDEQTNLAVGSNKNVYYYDNSSSNLIDLHLNADDDIEKCSNCNGISGFSGVSICNSCIKNNIVWQLLGENKKNKLY